MDPLRDEQVLLVKFKDGNNKALQRIFTLWYKPLVYFANKIINDLPQAEDITAESFYYLYTHRSDFQSLPAIKAFLYMANRNACLNFLKARRRHQASHQEVLYLSSSSADDKQHLDDLSQKIPSLLHNLPLQCRQVFTMIYFHGMATKDIAAALGLSNQTVLNHKQRAVHYLRLALQKQGCLLMFSAALCLL